MWLNIAQNAPVPKCSSTYLIVPFGGEPPDLYGYLG